MQTADSIKVAHLDGWYPTLGLTWTSSQLSLPPRVSLIFWWYRWFSLLVLLQSFLSNII